MSKRPIPVVGAIITAILVIVFANPPFYDWIHNPKNVNPNGAIGSLLNWLTWPHWLFTKGSASMATFVARELRAILIIAIVFGILAILAKGIGSAGVGFVVGWVAVILSAALSAFITYFIAGGNGSTFSGGLDALSQGGTYGLIVGWIVGIGTSVAKRG
ncbi:MAG TPA: hypothetical protein VH561_14710 [Micromonosporaceae bacterium]|jgi:hypothetical protein